LIPLILKLAIFMICAFLPASVMPSIAQDQPRDKRQPWGSKNGEH